MQKNFVVYKSSAGSGKTFTLVKEYLRIALSENSEQPQLFKKILAVTFTNKAAAEMKERITETLKTISVMNKKAPPLIAEVLCKELKLEIDELIKRAKRLLSQILHNYSDFSIGTIDSFTHRIIKTFAFDLKLPVNFTVETDVEDFYTRVVSALIAKVGENKTLTALLKDFSVHNADSNSSWDPEPGLLNFANTLKKEDTFGYLQKLQSLDNEQLQKIHHTLKEKIKTFQSFLKTEGEQALKIIRAKHLNDSHFHYGKSGPQNFFKKCSELNFDSLEDLIGNRIKEAVRSNKWHSNSNSDSNNAALDSIIPQLNQIASHLISFLEENYKAYSLHSLLEKNIHALLLINELRAITEEFKQDEQIIFISEFNEKIAQVVKEEPAPFIYERLGERYQHFLIDEFQDTSTLQWQNILPLLDNALANGRFNLIVGDGKQSIYRWRNANVRQFSTLPLVENSSENLLFAERQENLHRNYSEQLLDSNYRSLGTIVDFNNSLFRFLPEKLLSGTLQNIYKGQEQKKKFDSGGYVSIEGGTFEKEELNEKNKERILAHINNALHSGFLYSDICIIVRGNQKGNLIADFLVDNSVPVISSDSLLLKNSPEVACVLSILSVLLDPSDKIHAALVLNSICNHNIISKSQLTSALKSLKTSSLFSILNAFGIALKEEQLAGKNVFDICLDIIEELKLHIKNPPYIRFFLDEVNDYLVNKSGSVSDFLSWWDKRKAVSSVIIPEGTNAVKIMTIHKSKGLEFPVVIMPFVNWETFRQQQAWVDIDDQDIELPVALFNITNSLTNAGLGDIVQQEKEEQYLDNLNLLYVGFTRAVERLHIISCKSKTQRKELVSDWISSYINTIHPGSEFCEFGKAEPKHQQSKNSSHPVFELDQFKFNSNSDLIKIKGSHKLKITDETHDAREKGIKMHYILSEILTPKDIDPVLEKMLSQGLIISEEKIELTLKIESLLQNPLLAAYFNENLITKNEAELITEQGEILRPDKIILEKESAIVIDYKTGKQNNSYKNQMLKYETALKETGIKSVKKILVYVEENLVEELP